VARNATGSERLFIGKRHELFKLLVHQVHEHGKQGRDGGAGEKIEEVNNVEEKMDNEVKEGNAGEPEENGIAMKNGNDLTAAAGDEYNGEHGLLSFCTQHFHISHTFL
jgi:hypothetical protein